MFASVLWILSISCMCFFILYIFFSLLYVVLILPATLEKVIRIVFPAIFTCMIMLSIVERTL
ncbi:hypothetical protein B7492_33355 (plasmid) [Bacillus mycoides]|uniref:Uncharacterized protein n=1 Tax=Bacillus mycoides TaxID=1405 RepID=A0A1W6AJB1_BACMY|nr:hypothetical protein B7492_33355 [Bacillus mycoides]